MARARFELATPTLSAWCSNQAEPPGHIALGLALFYKSSAKWTGWDLNPRPPACGAGVIPGLTTSPI